MSDINHNVCPVVDFSNSKIRVLLGESVNNQIALLANVSVKNEGIREGRIVDMPRVIEALKVAITEAEKQSGYQIHSLNASIDAVQTQSTVFTEQIASSAGEIKEKDIAYLISLLQNRVSHLTPIHFIPQYFLINNNQQNPVKDPIGLSGNSLLASIYSVYTDKVILKNIKTAIRRVGVNLNALISSAYASAYAATTQQERENKVFVLDIGEETSSFFCFNKGFPIFGGGFNCGGKNITNYIANRLQISPELAEKLKITHGDISPAADDYEIRTESIATPIVKNIDLSEYTRQAYKEVFEVLFSQLPKGTKIPSNTILTGGGSMIKGFSDFLKGYYGAQSRIEYYDPTNSGEDLGLITAYGMLKLRFSGVKDFIEFKRKEESSWKEQFKKFIDV